MKYKGPQWKTYRTLSALDCFRLYWLENENLIENAAGAEEERTGPKWVPRTEEEQGEFEAERRISRQMYDEIIMPTARYSSIVMLHVVAERELLRLVHNLLEEGGLDKSKFKSTQGSVLDPATKFCANSLRFPIDGYQGFEALSQLLKIRNCIVHCNGEFDLVKSTDAQECLLKLAERQIGSSFAKDRASRSKRNALTTSVRRFGDSSSECLAKRTGRLTIAGRGATGREMLARTRHLPDNR